MDWETIFEKTTALQWILIALFLAALAVQFRAYLFVYLRLPRYTPPKKRKSSKPVSVVICAKNEEENLRQFLPRVLEQEYPDFEVVVVNDSSTDDTDVLLAELSARYSHLRYTSIPANEKFLHGKKLALTIGLKAARHPHVVLTDADCYPLSDQWLQAMASHLTGETKIVLGMEGMSGKGGS